MAVILATCRAFLPPLPVLLDIAGTTLSLVAQAIRLAAKLK